MQIKASTNIVALIGHPVEHSFSPPMHNAAFKHMNMDYIYTAFDVKPDNLSKAIEGGEALGIKGFNVTIPHKINVCRYLDEIDEVAALIGAVNTVDFKDMKGYNTDGIGAVKAIEEVSKVKNKSVVVMGSGGASRAISLYLAKYGADNLVILNRNTEKSDRLASDVLNSNMMDNVKSDSIANINSYIDDCEILINTTPVGMYPNVNEPPLVTSGDMHEGLVVFDAVYNPNETGLLSEAIEAAAKPVYGIKMLLYQGAESFRIWTGRSAPVDIMQKQLTKTLGFD